MRRKRGKVVYIKVSLMTRFQCTERRHELTTQMTLCLFLASRKHRQSSPVICTFTKNFVITAATQPLPDHNLLRHLFNKRSSGNRSLNSCKLSSSLSLSALVAVVLCLSLDGAVKGVRRVELRQHHRIHQHSLRSNIQTRCSCVTPKAISSS